MVIKGCCTEWEQEIILYLDNELSPKSRSRVESHLSRCSSCAWFYRQLEREECLIAGHLYHETHVHLPSDEFTDEIMGNLPDSKPRTYTRKVVELMLSASREVASKGKWHVTIAASILICLAGALATLSVGHVPKEEFINIKRYNKWYPCRIHEPIVISDLNGEFFEFPDGSIAYATYGTCFTIESYQEGSSDSNVGRDRQLRLKMGSLFLDIRPRKERFSVVCSNARASVFGTQFYIDIDYGPKKTTTVAVREGRVQVEKLGHNQTATTVLDTGQMTRVYSANGVYQLQPPSQITGALLRQLDVFYNARSDRSIQQRMITITGLAEEKSKQNLE